MSTKTTDKTQWELKSVSEFTIVIKGFIRPEAYQFSSFHEDSVKMCETVKKKYSVCGTEHRDVCAKFGDEEHSHAHHPALEMKL